MVYILAVLCSSICIGFHQLAGSHFWSAFGAGIILVWVLVSSLIFFFFYCLVCFFCLSRSSPCHCIVYSAYCITMWYLCVVVLWPQSSYLPRRKNRHGHWVCWMSMGRKNGSMSSAHIRSSSRSRIVLYSILPLLLVYIVLCSSICIEFYQLAGSHFWSAFGAGIILVWVLVSSLIFFFFYCLVCFFCLSRSSPCHCIVYSAYCITMWYLCVVVLWPQSSYLPRRKNRHGHWVCWMSMGRKTGFLMWITNTLEIETEETE